MNDHIRALLALLRPLPKTPAAEQSEKTVSVSGNFLKVTNERFSEGVLHFLELRGGALRMLGSGEGIWVSPVYTAQNFNDLVLSWNSETPDGTYAELFGRARLSGSDVWTSWLSWGKWSTRIARASVRGEDAYSYANSVPGYGDSSLNLKEGYIADAFQIKAVLHADTDAACPALRLVAATWKNTADPQWHLSCSLSEPEVPEAPSVLLDTPAFAQKARHPDYGGVICSATCMAMLLSGRGEDLLPEDLTMLCYDNGFGGNGNWSFTTAAAGAYGFESYVHYASFAGLRQELNRGYAVALSVKYSKDPDGKYPYLCNAPTNTGGHLITIVGYRWDDELKEYVYYSNDPATSADSDTAHREYRESQLDKAWYRRAAYFVHDKVSTGDSAQTRLFAALRPVAGKPGLWALVADGAVLRIPPKFTEKPRECFGHGTIFWTAENDWRPLPDGVLRRTGNLNSRYDGFSVTEDGFLRFEQGTVDKVLSDGLTVTVHVIDNSGQAVMALADRNAVPFIEQSEKTVMKTGKLWRYALPVGLAAAATVVLLKKRKKNRDE